MLSPLKGTFPCLELAFSQERNRAPDAAMPFAGSLKRKKGIGLKITGCTNRRFLPNLMVKRVWIPEEKRFVTLRLSTAALRTIDKKGVSAVLHQLRKKREKGLKLFL